MKALADDLFSNKKEVTDECLNRNIKLFQQSQTLCYMYIFISVYPTTHVADVYNLGVQQQLPVRVVTEFCKA